MSSDKLMNNSKLWHKQLLSNCRRLLLGGCFYIPLFLFMFGGARAQGPGNTPPAATIPVFRWVKHDQGVVSNADLPKGRLLLFVFFDPDCDHCKRAVAHMEGSSADYGSAAIYFVSMESFLKIDRFVASYAPRLAAQRNVLFLRDPGGGYMLGFHPIRFPSLFLYSPEHKLLDYEDNEETLFRIKRSIAAFAASRK